MANQQILPPVPYKSSLTDANGLISYAWTAFFRQLYQRAGGALAPSNSDLADTQTAAIAAVQANVDTLSATVTSLQSQLTAVSDFSGGLTQGRAL